ncbi:MAG: hypothetical protein ACREQ4_05920 [Candidatus Binataceae bacterium]
MRAVRQIRRQHSGGFGMRRVVALLCALAMLAAAALSADAQDYTVERKTSQALTAYLRTHRLPLVGAQVLTSAAGKRLILYGYVATSFGKTDARKKALKFLKQPNLAVENRIVIQPEIVRLKSPLPKSEPRPPASSSAPPSYETPPTYASAPPEYSNGGQSFDQVYKDIQRYGIKAPPGEGSGNSPF